MVKGKCLASKFGGIVAYQKILEVANCRDSILTLGSIFKMIFLKIFT